MIFASKDVYKGGWLNGLQHGKGKMTYVGRGTAYEGDWQNGMKHGQA
jgi:hypothetical protein